MKTACCGRSGILLYNEITKSASETQNRQYEGDKSHGTATVLRLVEHWFYSNLHVCGDSHFDSVPSTEMLWEVGMTFSGPTNTATSFLPLK